MPSGPTASTVVGPLALSGRSRRARNGTTILRASYCRGRIMTLLLYSNLCTLSIQSLSRAYPEPIQSLSGVCPESVQSLSTQTVWLLPLTETVMTELQNSLDVQSTEQEPAPIHRHLSAIAACRRGLHLAYLYRRSDEPERFSRQICGGFLWLHLLP